MKALFLIVNCTVTMSLYAQPPDTLWTRNYGGSGGMYSITNVLEMSDGELLLANGITYDMLDSAQIRLLVVDETGNPLDTVIQGSLHNVRGLCRWQNYGFASASTIYDGDSFLYNFSRIAAYDQLGNAVWLRDLDLPPQLTLRSVCGVAETAAGDLISCGKMYENGRRTWIARLDSEGELLLDSTYILGESDEPVDLVVVNDESVVLLMLSGSLMPDRPANTVLAKFSLSGEQQWSREFRNGIQFAPRAVISTSDGGFTFLANRMSSTISENVGFVYHLNSEGDSLWAYSFGGPGGRLDALSTLADGAVVIAGSTRMRNEENDDVYVAKIAASGEVVWSRSIGDDHYEVSDAIVQTSDGGFAIGATKFLNSMQTAWLIRLDIDLRADPSPIEPPTSFTLHQNYPNPFNPTTEIRYELAHESNVLLRVFDINGRDVETIIDNELSAGTHTVTFDAHNLPSGLYFYRLDANGYSETKKMVLLK